MQQVLSKNLTIGRQEINFFKTNGYLVIENCLADWVVKSMQSETSKFLEAFSAKSSLDNVDFLYEDSSSTLRLVRNVHETNPLFKKIINDEQFCALAEKLIVGEAEIVNTKLNFKNAFTGEQFDWHQDSIYLGENCTESIAFIIAIDEVTHQNGPMMVIPKSHQHGIIQVPHRDVMTQDDLSQYPKTRTENLSYSLPNDVLEENFKKFGIESFVGSPGTIFAMHCSTFHASNLNLSPSSRASFLARFRPI